MQRIDISGWKEFIIGDLFEIYRPVARSQMDYEEGNVPFVASSNFNNGIVKWCTPQKEEQLDKGNSITVSPLDGSAFYQKVDFLGRGGAGSAILILQNNNLNERNGLFISAVFCRSLTSFSYSDQINLESIASAKIKLPKTAEGDPDWQYMDSYMQKVMISSEASLEVLRQADTTERKLNLSKWKDFRAADLFDIQKGKRLTSANRTEEGDTPYIGALNHDNGVFQYIAQQPIFHGNSISVNYNSSAIGQAYYQEKDFWATDDVNVWYFREKNNYEFNRNIALFICAIVIRLGKAYAYTDKWKLEDMQNAKLRLPVTPEGNPDWKYMDLYMEGVLADSGSKLTAMTCMMMQSDIHECH